MRVKKVTIKEVEILFIDYSHAKEAEMIETLLLAKKNILAENKKIRTLSILKNTFVTPHFMSILRKELTEVIPFIEKQAIIGLNEPKKWILKGLNILFSTDYRAFDSEDEAIAYLIAP